MKNTRYFDDYQSAYNYYGGAVVPSTEIALVGNGSYVFVSSDNAFGGNQQYFDANLTNDEIVDNLTYTAYNQGFSYGESVTYPIAYEAGYSYGYDIGETAGYDTGYVDGEAAGYNDGYAEGETAGYETGYSAGQASAVPSYTDQQKFAISSGDMMTKGSLNNINYGVMTPSYSFDTSIWSSLTQMAQGHYAVLYKWSGSTMTTLPFYSNYDEEVGATEITINVGTQDQLAIQDALIYATATLAAGDKICVGFYALDGNTHTGQFSGISSASSLYTVQTAGDYIIVIYPSGYDDETGEPLPPVAVVSSNPYNASGTVLPMQPVQS